MSENTEKEKSNIQKVIDLLEEHGFHVIKAVEETSGLYEIRTSGAIHLRIFPKEEVTKGKPKNCIAIEGDSPAQAVKDVAAAVSL